MKDTVATSANPLRWRSLGPGTALARWLRAVLPSLGDYVSTTPAWYEQSALGYLSQGVPCALYYDPGLIYEVLQPGNIQTEIPIGETEARYRIYPFYILRDDVWLWPSVLLYYIYEYPIIDSPAFPVGMADSQENCKILESARPKC